MARPYIRKRSSCSSTGKDLPRALPTLIVSPCGAAPPPPPAARAALAFSGLPSPFNLLRPRDTPAIDLLVDVGCCLSQCGAPMQRGAPRGSRGVPAGEGEIGTTRTFSSRAPVRFCLCSLLLPLPPSPSPLRSAFSLTFAASTLKYFHHAQRALPSAASRPPPPHSQPAIRARASFPALLPSPPVSPSPRSSPPPPKLSPD